MAAKLQSSTARAALYRSNAPDPIGQQLVEQARKIALLLLGLFHVFSCQRERVAPFSLIWSARALALLGGRLLLWHFISAPLPRRPWSRIRPAQEGHLKGVLPGRTDSQRFTGAFKISGITPTATKMLTDLARTASVTSTETEKGTGNGQSVKPEKLILCSWV